MAFPNYTRTLSDGRWNVDIAKLSKEIEAAVPGKAFRLRANDTTIVVDDGGAFDATEKTDTDTAVSDHIAADDPLPGAKAAKVAAIEDRTQQLILEGFEHPAESGDFYSLDGPSRDLVIGAFAAKDLLPYPITWNTIDSTGEISIADAAAMQAFFVSAMLAVKGHEDSGTALKASVRAAVDLAAVDAIEDTR